MPRIHAAFPLTLLAGLLACGAAIGAEAQPPADRSQPVTTARVGGSPADLALRTATQESGDRYRKARAACKTKAGAERSACVSAARADLKRERLAAKAAHDAARKKPR
jgi:hypothetical protein